jgi:hypothetical protein
MLLKLHFDKPPKNILTNTLLIKIKKLMEMDDTLRIAVGIYRISCTKK